MSSKYNNVDVDAGVILSALIERDNEVRMGEDIVLSRDGDVWVLEMGEDGVCAPYDSVEQLVIAYARLEAADMGIGLNAVDRDLCSIARESAAMWQEMLDEG
jgi:hypothetical protein